jgi:hypothetical protein
MTTVKVRQGQGISEYTCKEYIKYGLGISAEVEFASLKDMLISEKISPCHTTSVCRAFPFV